MNFEGKSVVYIGGFGGIGQKCLQKFLHKGVKNLFIFDLKPNEEYLETLQTQFPLANIDYMAVDMSERETIEKAYKMVMQKIDQLDIVVNGSGILDETLIDLTVAVNLTGVIHSSLMALNYMSKAKGGRGGMIVNISSVAGVEPCAAICVYSATKFGVTAFTRSLAYPNYYKETGVKCITICPGCTVTPILEDWGTKSTFPEHFHLFDEFLAKAPSQTAQQFSQSFIKVLAEADNGSVWILQNGMYKEVEFPKFWTV